MSLSNLWYGLKDLQSILRLCRANIFVLAVGLAFLLLVPQGRDCVQALAEPPLSERSGLLAWFFLATGIWALNIWYWARIMLRFRWNEASSGPGLSGRAHLLRKHVPRLLGTLAFVVVAAAFAKAATETEGDTARGHWILALWALALAVGFYVFVACRRGLLSRLVGPRGRPASTVGAGSSPYADDLMALRQLEWTPRAVLVMLILVTVSLFATFSINAALAVHVGAGPILLLAGSAWVVFGAVLIYFATRYEVPVLSILVLLLVLFSLWNDNHGVRTLAGRDPVDRTPAGSSVAEHFDQWLSERQITASAADRGYPVVVVAAEGGGIRAAYWTATILSRLQDEFERSAGESFADHLYAISGVSGGSLGGAVFAALIKEQAAAGQLACPDGVASDRGPFESCAHEVLRQDFLSPTLAAMFYPDLVQRFLPLAIPHFDRSRALEKAWERAWSDLLPSSRFGGRVDDPGFDDLWRGGKPGRPSLYRVPLLFLNSTWVETGKRVIISPVSVGNEFKDALDFFDQVGRSVRLSTAVHNSARFTYVSPAGTVAGRNGEVWGHLVDGGYFENSGATTALEILQAMRKGAGDRWTKLRPIVLMITNDPALDRKRQPRRWLNEALSPVVALLATRGARGSYSRETLKGFAEESCPTKCFLEIGLENVTGVPLGWALSGDAIGAMKDKVAEKLPDVLVAVTSSSGTE